MKYILSFVLLCSSVLLRAQDSTITYNELIDAYQELADSYDQCDFIQFGTTDAGKPLHLFVINSDGYFFPAAFTNKSVILIQNGIHAGEPCGIDASLQLATEMLANNSVPKNVVIGIIPVYSVGGMLNRGVSRANQNGPHEHGFRGNAQNLDLNRDFLKADSRNAFAFYRIFHWLRPNLFVDTHTSNGADYQYTMSVITTRHERLNTAQATFLTQKLEPYLFTEMDTLTPYVNVFGGPPNNGFAAFNDAPIYSTGYTSLFNCIGFTTEAHMLKPFDKRVEYTHNFLQVLTTFADSNYKEIVQLKRAADSEGIASICDLNLKLDKTKNVDFQFFGYEYYYDTSAITQTPQLYYDQSKPRTFNVKYYNTFTPNTRVKVPKFYVVKAAFVDVIERFQANNIQMEILERDTFISGLGWKVTDVTYSDRPYEGHWPLQNVICQDTQIIMQFFEGDYLIPTDQVGVKYIMQTLEPMAAHSFLRWNFFDIVLQQKEYFSSYVFEPYAQKMLETDQKLRETYENKLTSDSAFAADGGARLQWLYMQSPYSEKEYKRLPYLRIY